MQNIFQVVPKAKERHCNQTGVPTKMSNPNTKQIKPEPTAWW